MKPRYDKDRLYTLKMLSTDRGDGIIPYSLNSLKKAVQLKKLNGKQFKKGGKLWFDPDEIERFLKTLK